MPIFSVGCAAPSDSPVGEFLETTAEVPARVRRRIVVDVEQAIAGVLAIATANVEAGARRDKVPVIARVRCVTTGRGCRDKHREATVCLDLECGRPAIGRNAHRRAAAAVAELGGIQDDVQAVAVVVRPDRYILATAANAGEIPALIEAASRLSGLPGPTSSMPNQEKISA